MDWVWHPISGWVWFPSFALVSAIILSVRFEMYTRKSAWFSGFFVCLIYVGTYSASLLEGHCINGFVIMSVLVSPFVGAWIAVFLKRLR